MTKNQVLILTVLTAKFVTSTFTIFEIKNPGKPAFDQKFYEDLLDVNVCQEQLSYVQSDLYLNIRFIDSGIRIPRGIQKGNFLDLGDYHECLGINEDTGSSRIEGKYCQIHESYFELENTARALDLNYDPKLKNSITLGNLKKSLDFNSRMSQTNKISTNIRTAIDLPINSSQSVPITLAVCVPKTCTVEEGLRGIYNRPNTSLGFHYEVGSCRVLNDKQWAPADYVAVILFSAIGLLTILSTGYDVWHQIIMQKDPKTIKMLLISCSIYTNTIRLTTFSGNSRNLECIDGLRAISMLWIIVGHCFSTIPTVWNSLDMLLYFQSWRSLWLTIAPFAVDTFFKLSGILLVYTSVGKMTSLGLLKNLHLFYLHRILRMFPLLAAVVLLQASVFHRIADGPVWDTVVYNTESCRSQWWLTLLFVQNYLNTPSLCISQSWFVAIDMQLYLISPIILFWVLSGKPRLAWSALILALALSLTTTTIFNFIKQFPGWLLVPQQPDRATYAPNYYLNTFTRAPPYLFGMLFGYVLYEWRDKTFRISRSAAVVLWICALGLMMILAYPVYLMLQPDNDMWILDATVNSFARTLWCLALSWIIFACHKGYGGPVNWFLSHNLWKLPSRISYAMYLVHYPIQHVLQGTAVRLFYYSVGNVIYECLISQLALVFVVSFVLTLVIDSPFSTIVKLLLGGGPKKPGKQENRY